ncbi:MAG: beta-lactamase family protein [Deltaproteobacteria bacterium]|nr:beta-lactamase family protein [Deltaproteobacteria bacterium]
MSQSEGFIHPDFWSVARLFKSLVPDNEPGGAALCIYHQGRKVVDLWGGTSDTKGTPWKTDTASISYSTTKGVASTLFHTLVDEGLIDYDEPVCKHWPEFAHSGKAAITIRQVMCHEAGLYDIRAMIDHASRMMDWNYMVRALEAAHPVHEPGKAHGYHGLTYGYLVGELIQRVTGKPFSQVLEEKLALPLGLEGLFIGLPAEQSRRKAMLILSGIQGGGGRADRYRSYLGTLNRWLRMIGVPIDLREAEKALIPHGIDQLDWNSPEFAAASIPSANGVFTARSLARLYAALAAGGELDGVRILSEKTLFRAATVQNRTVDRVIPFPMHWRLGYHRPFLLGPSVRHAIGHFGFGGSGAWADLDRNLSVALTLNSGVGTPVGDLRIIRVSTAAARCADRR